MRVKRRDAPKCGWHEEAGAEQKALHARISNAKADELGHVLLSSEWEFAEQADLLNWVGVIDRIDAALESSIKDHPGLVCSADEKPPEPCPEPVRDLVRGCLRFSTMLLTNSIQKHVYNSLEVRSARAFAIFYA